jgi:hypothetical protein
MNTTENTDDSFYYLVQIPVKDSLNVGSIESLMDLHQIPYIKTRGNDALEVLSDLGQKVGLCVEEET